MNNLFFEKLGLNKNQSDIYIALYKLGSQPASIIAKHLGIERTKVYRNLLHLVNIGIVKKTQKKQYPKFLYKRFGGFMTFCR